MNDLLKNGVINIGSAPNNECRAIIGDVSRFSYRRELHISGVVRNSPERDIIDYITPIIDFVGCINPYVMSIIVKHGLYMLRHLIDMLGDDDLIWPIDKAMCIYKQYQDKGDEHGWHYEGNDYTGLLYLSVDCVGGDLIVIDRSTHTPDGTANGTQIRVTPNSGDIYLLKGHDVLHKVEPIERGFRALLVYNFYKASNYHIRDNVYSKKIK